MADGNNKLGPTGEYPDGKISSDDEGELMMGMSNDGRLVRVDFGSPVAWFAIPPELAMRMGENLIRHAMAIVSSRGKTDGTA